MLPHSIRPLTRMSVLTTVAVVVGTSFIAGCQKKTEAKKEVPHPEVIYVTPATEKVTQHEEFSGRTTSSKTVEIHARVGGYLKKIGFEDGAYVKEGTVLFEIEDETYRAALSQAEANIKQAEAKLANLKSQLSRSEKLIQKKVITREELETLEFQTQEAEGAKIAAEAARDLASINLKFCKVLAPISGRINRRQVDAGNLVKPDATLLATVVAPNPIYGYFDFDERTLLQMRRLVEEGKLKAAPDFDAVVKVALAGEDTFTLEGKIDWVDNQIDAGTGTLRARVNITNPSIDTLSAKGSSAEQSTENDDRMKLLSPGMFVRLMIPIGPEESVLMIPEEALGSDQGQRFVYVVNDKNEIEYRSITVGWLTGGRRVIRKGLEATDRIVVNGLQRVRPKSVVAPVSLADYEKRQLAAAKAKEIAAKEASTTDTHGGQKPGSPSAPLASKH